MTRFAKNILLLIIIVILLGIGLYHFIKTQKIEDNSNIVSDSKSLIGCYVNHTGKDIYTLMISSEDNGTLKGILSYNNFEKDSSSGTFSGTFSDGLLIGNYSFDSEGMHSDRQVIFKKDGDKLIQGFGDVKMENGKELFKDINNVTYDPKSTFTKSENCVDNFKDSNDVFSFDHNSFFYVVEGDSTPTTDWRISNTDKGTLLAQMFVPKVYIPKTNFSGVKLTVGRSSDEKVIRSCDDTTGIINQENKDSITEKVKLGGYDFVKFTTSDAGAGNYYDTTGYRGIVDGDCYAIEYTIHSTNIGNYSPEQGIKEFDKSVIKNDLEKVIKSFKFLINSN